MVTLAMALGLAGCGQKDGAETKAPEVKQKAMPTSTDYSLVNKKSVNEGELPTWIIPNMPESAEAYYRSDSYHVIAQTQDPDAVAPSHARAAGGARTSKPPMFTRSWSTIRKTQVLTPRMSAKGSTACSSSQPQSASCK